MDNITHSLTGLAVGELIHRILPPEAETRDNTRRRLLLLLSCGLASNAPDLDLVLMPLLEKPLGYLLMHRGHTHTFLFVLPQGLLLALLFWILWPRARRLLQESSMARWGLALAIIGGLLLHLAFDFLNTYGIHPFYPFDNRWYYGDMVFIVEPFFWCTAGIAAVMSFRTPWLKWLAALSILVLPMLAAAVRLIPWSSSAVLGLFTLSLGLLQMRASARTIFPLVLALGLDLAFVLFQGYLSSHVRELAAANFARRDPESQLLDIARTPLPANPFCWSVQAIAVDRRAGTYHVHSSVLSAAPSLVSNCDSRLARAAEVGEGSLTLFQALAKEDCHANAWLRFARVPFIQAGKALDLRYASIRAPGGFTLLRLEDFKDRPCPSGIPPWVAPREDLFPSGAIASD